MTSNELFRSISLLRQTVIRYPQFDFAYQQIEASLQLKREVDVAQHILCFGASGTGKSTLKREMEATYPRVQTKDHPIIPILVVDIPAIPTVKNVAESMLVHFGDPLAERGSAINKTERILRYLEHCQVELLIFDELQHFIDQGKKNTPHQVADWLKSLIDHSNIPTVLMGLERGEQILKVNEQLRRRFNRRIHLEPFPLKAKEDYLTFAGVLAKLSALIPLPMGIDLKDTEVLDRIHYATNGVIDYMVTLLLGAYEMAIQYHIKRIDIACFKKSFIRCIWASSTEKLNPFNDNFSWVPLTKIGMPFHIHMPK